MEPFIYKRLADMKSRKLLQLWRRTPDLHRYCRVASVDVSTTCSKSPGFKSQKDSHDGRLDADVSTKESGSHFSDDFFLAVIGGAEGPGAELISPLLIPIAHRRA